MNAIRKVYSFPTLKSTDAFWVIGARINVARNRLLSAILDRRQQINPHPLRSVVPPARQRRRPQPAHSSTPRRLRLRCRGLAAATGVPFTPPRCQRLGRGRTGAVGDITGPATHPSGSELAPAETPACATRGSCVAPRLTPPIGPGAEARQRRRGRPSSSAAQVSVLIVDVPALSANAEAGCLLTPSTPVRPRGSQAARRGALPAASGARA